MTSVATTSPAAAPDSLEARVRALLERVLARADRQAEAARQRGLTAGRYAGLTHSLKWVEEQIGELESAPNGLTAYGHQLLKGHRERRQQILDQLQKYGAPFRAEETEIRKNSDQARKLMLRAGGVPDPAARLEALLGAFEPVRAHLTPTEAETTLPRLVSSVERESQGAAAGSDQPSPIPTVEPPPPAPWVFEPPDPVLFQPCPGQGARDLDEYRLHRRAQELSLVRGFDVLLTPALATGLAQYPHQIETARMVLRRMRGRALLCDEVGLGKTIEAGIIARELVARGLARRILVLAPPALVGQWQEEMRGKFGLEFRTHDDPEFRAAGPDAWKQFDRILASLATARQPAHRAVLEKEEFDLIIVDEAHHLRSRTSLGWKFVNALKKRYILLLTATPVQNNLDELFNLITLLAPGQLNTSAAFRKEFVQKGDPRTPRNRERLRQLLAEVMVRNTRSQVHIAMPPRLATTHRVTPEPEEAALYSALTAFARTQAGAGGLDRMTLTSLLRQAGSSTDALHRGLAGLAERRSAIREAVTPLLEQAKAVQRQGKLEQAVALLTARGDKTVLFTFFRETVHALSRALDEAGISHAVLSGELDAAGKDRAVREFAHDRQVLLSTDVGSEGRNLQFCHSIVNFDLPWNPMRIEQRVGRVHRIGQREAVLIDNFCARHTLEEQILRVLDSKLNMFELVIGEIGAVLGNLESDQEFEELALEIWTGSQDEAEAEQGFDRLAEQLLDARQRHRQSEEFDAALFGDELATRPAEEDR